MFDNGFFCQTKSDCFFNSRTKYYIGSDGALIPYEMMICNRQVFSDGGNEISEFSRSVQERLDYIAAAEELFGDKSLYRGGAMNRVRQQNKSFLTRLGVVLGVKFLIIVSVMISICLLLSRLTAV